MVESVCGKIKDVCSGLVDGELSVYHHYSCVYLIMFYGRSIEKKDTKERNLFPLDLIK